MALLRIAFLLCALAAAGFAQDEEIAPEKASKPPVKLIFTPPDLDGRIVLGIFDDAGRLRRTMAFEDRSPDLLIDTNGYIAQWDGRDDAGQPCPPGRYSAHGYVVGDEVDVEGAAFAFNDWMAEDGIPAADVMLRRWPDGVGVEIATAKGAVFRRIDADGALKEALPPAEGSFLSAAASIEGSNWMIVNLDGQHAVFQLDRNNVALRELRVPAGEPQPVEVLAVPGADAILLKETEGRVVRVRVLRRGAAGEEKDGRKAADWEVVFERTFVPCAKFGLVDGRLSADAGEATDSLEISLVENALSSGAQKLRLKAAPASPGSALFSPEGLELVGVSSAGTWNRFALTGDGRAATLYQGDGVVVEEFALRNLDHIARFDAGSFLLASPAQ